MYVYILFIFPVDEDQPRTIDFEAGNGLEPDEDQKCDGPKNGHPKVLQRMETVPDIKKDTSGITTQYIATGIGKASIRKNHQHHQPNNV
jgi:hypothetical protein